MHDSDAAGTDAFSALVERTREPLRRYLVRRVRVESVDDLLQSVFETAWRRRRRIPPDGELPWLYSVAGNVVRNHTRTGHRRAAILVRYLPFLASPTESAGNATTINDPRLAAALASLDPDDREVLQLWAWEDLDYKEIAVALGVTPTAAASRLSRAKSRLASRMEEL